MLRIFGCRDCGHKMRLAGSRCGYCRAPKEITQRVFPYAVSLTVFLLGVALLLAG
ncbi:hypothetical protein COL8621_01685 [Actibacterium lipolyticum]|uniref:Uncharacterized protein n=1 Tax=Actibacterium lipolyticum TaxID=1524263 RepID=A0A238JZ84_9RHOB|nr:hypothetical protein COL8621_01685 [Actibacterium lipolyticum]